MLGIRSRVSTYLDAAATVALALSVTLLLVLFADLFTPPPGTVGAYFSGRSDLAEAAAFLGFLSTPTISCAIAWPIHVRQKRRGEKVFGWLRFAVLASALWMLLVFVGVTEL